MRLIVRRHLTPYFGLAILTAFWLAPLLVRLTTVLPGPGAGDNATFVWNLWWMRYALHHEGQSFFQTTFLFHPMGADLTLHTHTALPAFLMALVGPSSLIASQNLLVVANVYLNFACSYALAFRLTGRIIPALVAAVIFGTSVFVTAHLWGHFNLTAAWTLPLALVLAKQASDHSSLRRAALAGALIAAVAYIDYYLFVYAVVLVALYCVSEWTSVSRTSGSVSRLRKSALIALGILLAIDVVAIATILLWHGDTVHVGRWRISIRSVNNPMTGGWILLVVAGALVVLPRIRVRMTIPWWPGVRILLGIGAVTLALVTPLIVRGARLFIEGRYVSQPYQWRSAPAGVDVASFALGNPSHLIWGEHVRRMYASLHIDPIEASGWIPLSALSLAAVALVTRRKEFAIRQMAVLTAVFMTWALGPWLVAFGSRTPILLPTIAIRYVPILANARIPGRAMAVAYLGIAMLAAFGTASLLTTTGRARWWGWSLVALVLLESLPASPPTFQPDMPSQYALLRDHPAAGAICELPLGVRDGFGEVGKFDSEVLLHQTLHERPIVGGFLARLSPDVVRQYQQMPVIGSFLRLSAGAPLSAESTGLTPTEAASALASEGVGFVVLDTRRAPPDLVEYVQSNIALRRIAEQDGRVFYRVH